MPDQRLLNKVCIVTGSTGGIGEAISELFAEHGAHIVISGRNIENGNSIAQRIVDAGNIAHFIRADVAIDSDCEALIRQTVDHFGGLDILVNNAAATDSLTAQDAASLQPEDWDRQMQVNLRAVYIMSRLAIPEMKNRGGGTIVNISSVGGMVAWPNAVAYLTAKGGVNQMTRAMAVDFIADNIRVNALCPGWILTPVEQRRLKKDPELMKRNMERMGITRMGKPREMAYPALFLACDESSYVTGTTLVADGGWTLR